MPSELPILFALILATALSAVAAQRLRVPLSILLVLLGLAAGFVPHVPRVAIRPDLMLLLLLPPLLYSSGVGMSWRSFRADLAPILMLAVGCVLATAASVAVAMHVLLGMPLAVGFVLGAVVAPPDAVAPMAIVRRLSVPRRILTVLEGEGLVNDATALILFSFAVTAVTSGQFSLGDALGGFAAIVAGELAWGIAAGWSALRVRRWVGDPHVEIVIALLTPFVTFWVPHALGGSGVLATVVAGLWVSWNGPRFIAPATRLQGFFVWDVLVYLIEGVIFLLTGLQARVVADGLDTAQWRRLALAVAVTSIVVIVARFLWVVFAASIPRILDRRRRMKRTPPPWQQSFIVGFTGIRGVVSLAAALSIPLTVGGHPFPDRGLILLVTFCIILVTLVGQGSLLPWVIDSLGLANTGKREAETAKRAEIAARISGINATLAELDRLAAQGATTEIVAALRRRHTDRRAFFFSACEQFLQEHPRYETIELQFQLIEAERAHLAQLYAKDALDDEARRRIERELDLEDSRLRQALESGAGEQS